MKYIFVLVAFIAAIEVDAQTSKGSWLIGGSFKVQRSATNVSTFDNQSGTVVYYKSKYASVGITPTVGYFFVDNLMTGLQVNETFSWTLGSSKNKTNVFALGPLIRYYFPVQKVAFFPEVAYQYYKQEQTLILSSVPETFVMKGNVLRAGAGVAWFISPNIGIEGILAYQTVDYKGGDSNDGNLLYYNIGIQFYLPKKQD